MVLAALIARSEPGDRCSIGDEDQAARRGMHGSPTILIDGIDPFAVPGQPASVSCRRTGIVTAGPMVLCRSASSAGPSDTQSQSGKSQTETARSFA